MRLLSVLFQTFPRAWSRACYTWQVLNEHLGGKEGREGGREERRERGKESGCEHARNSKNLSIFSSFLLLLNLSLGENATCSSLVPWWKIIYFPQGSLWGVGVGKSWVALFCTSLESSQPLAVRGAPFPPTVLLRCHLQGHS